MAETRYGTIVRAVVAVAIIAGTWIVSSAGPQQWSEHALVVAEPGSVKLLRGLDDRGNSDDRIDVGSVFRVNLKNVEAIRGTLPQDRMTVDLVASHKGSIASERRIFLLLDVSTNEPQVLYWSTPQLVACVPAELVQASALEADFMFDDNRTSKLCTNAEWFH